ncbi:MAG TPA: hypothetical protein VK508_17930 [Cyclobacteriaceae bacterium]|nr:hypothetical protein [Cyclobacteriaceae bacterium]
MRSFLTAIFTFLLFGAVYAQKPDSITHHYDSLAKVKLSALDSSSNRVNNKIDSVQQRLNSILNPNLRAGSPFGKRPALDKKLPDSLSAVHDLDSMKHGLTHKIDSLKSLNLPTERYTRKLDSLNKISPARYVQQARQKLNNAQDKLNEPVNDIEQKINRPIDNVENKFNEKLSAINKEAGGDTGLPGNVDLNKNVKLPDAKLDTSIKTDGALKIPGTDVKLDNPLNNVDNPLAGKLEKAGDAKEKLNGIKQAPQQKIDQLKSAEQLKTVQEKAGKVNDLTDKTQGYAQDVRKVADGDLGEVKSVPDAIENKVKGMDEIKDLQNQQGLGELEKYKDMAGAANDPAAMKEMAKKQVLTQAKNHFAGKEKALLAGMEQLSKLKQKYPDMPTPEQLKKRVYNAMHGKPFIERIVPGLTLQIQKTSNVLVDLNPVVAYRISGVWNAGLGWNERFSFHKWNQMVPLDRTYGPRVFTSVVIAKGFGVKIEAEKMNTYVPNNPLTADAGHRQWVWSVFVGLKKDYRISKNIRGNLQTLYNLYDDHDNSPYTDRLSIRMGFEVPMKKRKK